MNAVNMSEPAWDVAGLFPAQGTWSEDEYLGLPVNRLVEFDSGQIEVLDMPGEWHQMVVAFLYRALSEYVRKQGLGVALFAPLPLKLWQGKLREPDVLFLRREHFDRRHETHWNGADLVMEVVSPSDPNRDKVIKKQEYARASIPEYWLVDPQEQTVTVFALSPDHAGYQVFGFYQADQRAESATLPGFSVELAELFTSEDWQ